jgi:hypothetical protein
MPNDRDWLRAELNDQDELAEAMFAHLAARIPTVQPSADFVDRTVQVAWRTRSRRRIVTRLVRIAALLTVIATFGSIYELRGFAVFLVVRSAVAVSHGLVWLVTSAGQGAGWWSTAERIGIAVSDAISAPPTAAALAAIEIVALFGIYAFHKLVRDELGAQK